MPMQHYHGGCQCGAVTYEVDVDLDQLSITHKFGGSWGGVD